MATSENVASYLTRITQVRDELGVIREKVEGNQLVQKTLNGATNPWVVFMEAIVARENMPTWDHIWDDFIQEETQRIYVHDSLSNIKEEEKNVAMSTKGNNSRKGPKGGDKQHKGEQKKNLSRVRWYA